MKLYISDPAVWKCPRGHMDFSLSSQSLSIVCLLLLCLNQRRQHWSVNAPGPWAFTHMFSTLESLKGWWKVKQRGQWGALWCNARTTVPLGDQWERTQYFLLFTKNLMNGCFNTCSNNAELLLFTWAVHLEHGSNLCPLRKTKDQLFNFIVNRMRFKILGHNS